MPDDSVADFAASLVRLLLNADLRRRLAAEARDYAMEWADERMAGRLADLYRSLVRGAAGQVVSHPRRLGASQPDAPSAK